MDNRQFNKISIAKVLVTAANGKLTVLKTQLIENSENLCRLRKNRQNK
jgi:hypothetical protein